MDMSVGRYLAIPAGAPRPASDAAALRDCLARSYGRLHGRLARHLGCADQASDCLHDAWLRLHDAGDAGVPGAVRRPEAYVYRVARNLAMDRQRAPHARLCVHDADAALDQLADEAPGPLAVAEARSRLRALARTFDGLPRRQQAVLAALRVEGLTRQEVAARYGLSLRSVDTAMRQALAHCAAAGAYG